jgi:Methylpurine-DNA glycosylase (MPG)
VTRDGLAANCLAKCWCEEKEGSFGPPASWKSKLTWEWMIPQRTRFLAALHAMRCCSGRPALEPLSGTEQMARSRSVSINSARDLRKLTSGPGRLAEAFGITRERDNGKDLTGARSDLFVADDGYRVRRILTTPRIGITKAAERPLRYLIAGNEFVSGPKRLAIVK